MTKILVGIPHHTNKNYSLEHAMNRANELTYPDKEVILRLDPSEFGSQNAVKKQREFFRRMALDGGYDYLFFMGVDTIPPADVLERLLRHFDTNDKIVGGVYWGRHNADNGDPRGAVAWIHEKSQQEQTEIFKQQSTEVRVDGMGMDCVLIPASALSEISWLDWEQNDDDYPFYDLAKQKGYRIIVDTTVQCKHYFTYNGYSYLSEKYESS